MFFHQLDDRLDGLHVFLALYSASLLGFGRRGGFSPLSFPAMTVTVGICTYGGFRRCSYFLYLSGYFNLLKYIAGLLVFLPFEVTSLYIGLFFPTARNGV